MIPLDSMFAAIGYTLWAVSWQVAVLIAFIGVLALFFRKASSSFRYFLWCTVLVRLCIPVDLKLPFDSADVIPPINNIVFLTSENLNGLSPASNKFGEISTLGAPQIIALFWLGILALILFLIIARFFQIRKMLAFCSPVVRPDLCDLLQRLRRELGMKQSVGLLSTDDDTIQTPLVAGVFSPVILLPLRIAESWSCEDLEPVLLHELIHIRRYDTLINRLQMILQALYFFHPLVWYSNRQIRKIREEVCDDLAIHRLRSDRKQYSLSILRIMEEALRESVWGWGGIGFSEKRSTIKERIRRIMDTHYTSWKPMTIGSIVLLGGIVILGFALSCIKKTDTITSNVSVEKTIVQPQQNSSSTIKINLIENGEYDIAGTHATAETIKQVLKAEMAKHPSNDVDVIITGSPKNENQINLAAETAHQVNVKGIGFDRKAVERFMHIGPPPSQPTNTGKIIINIIKKGEYDIAGTHATDRDFEQVLNREFAKNPDKVIMFTSESSLITMEEVYPLTLIAGKAGYKNIRFAIPFRQSQNKDH